MKRKPGTLFPIECSIVEAARNLQQQGIEEFHGFQIAKEMGDRKGTRFLTGYGTLYRALARLQKLGILESHWEEPSPDESRPRRRYYRLIGEVETTAGLNPELASDHNNSKILGLGVSQV